MNKDKKQNAMFNSLAITIQRSKTKFTVVQHYFEIAHLRHDGNN